MLFAFAKLQAQDYQISFAGSGATTTVENVQVQNLTKGTSLNLNGSDVLHLTTAATGIEQLSTNGDNSMRIYPNPLTSIGTIEFEISAPSLVTVELYDITGKKVTSTQNRLQAGTQTFNVSGLNTGIYTLSIKSDKFLYSGKIISNCTAKETANISYVNSTITLAKPHLKSTNSLVPMQYTAGDRILLKVASGNYSTTKTLVPVASSTETFNFVAATDGNGNNYGTVTIGTQVWMAENLKTTKYNDGTDILNVTDNTSWTKAGAAYCWYSNNYATIGSVYGALYNWYALDFETNGGKNIAPSGWHVASDAEWTTLTTYLGGESLAGEKMKETGSAHWPILGTHGTNQTGFTGLPCGFRSDSNGNFYNLAYNGGYYWSSTQDGVPKAWLRSLNYLNNGCFRGLNSSNKQTGCAVRCIKD